MNPALRLAMVALVLLNIAFVHITEAVAAGWTVLFAVLTALSPLLVRLAHRLPYRVVWNVAVLGTFGLLVEHVSRAGSQHLLEDGLVLAGLCQVHLVNNITARQKPDLLFFNSFLIVLVTSFLSFDLPYCLLFLLYVPVLVLALQLLVLARAGVPLTAAALRPCLAGGLGRSTALVVLTFALFLFLPRDFHRRGFVGELKLARAGALSDVGFSDRIHLGQADRVHSDGRVVLRVSVLQGSRPDVPAYWRGATLNLFAGSSWHADPNAAVLAPWRQSGRQEWRRALGPTRTRVEAELALPDSTRLLAPLNAARLHLGPPADRWRRVDTAADLTVCCDRRPGDRIDRRYYLDLAHPEARPLAAAPVPTEQVELHRRLLPSVGSRALALARGVVASTDARTDAELVQRLERELAARYRYLAPGAPGAAASLEAFLEGTGGGHCEYFATALALCLRTARVPCRVVTGFRSAEWDADGRTLLVRARDAHAWVEVLDPTRGWYTADATPAAGSLHANTAGGLLARLRSGLGRAWVEVAGFSAATRDRALAWLAALPGGICRAAARYPRETLLSMLGAAVLVWVRFRRRRGGDPRAVRDYRRELRQARLALAPGETPRELLARAQRQVLRPDRLHRLAHATQRHEAARYMEPASPAVSPRR
ncbi:MAG: DUF3488 domain-containing protein [Planctomycetes bacterium]|nr:DUF3488 domain-containing protein [Planctomycetota bacterium]